ncbi:hypothetical protein JS532_08195 [Bifidobacterium callimiconis]|uniref:hypothetical protein n=1 Tax=Bifidobacterium callimiconis TaxID=2306973 RepID=UPI001BDC34CA|nr:hypothetical protein [Bifidobacterium callimiconis]MBT1177539.1 hypothetical protein [Bifidobacterium callimiconis]
MSTPSTSPSTTNASPSTPNTPSNALDIKEWADEYDQAFKIKEISVWVVRILGVLLIVGAAALARTSPALGPRTWIALCMVFIGLTFALPSPSERKPPRNLPDPFTPIRNAWNTDFAPNGDLPEPGRTVFLHAWGGDGLFHQYTLLRRDRNTVQLFDEHGKPVPTDDGTHLLDKDGNPVPVSDQ